MTRTVARRLRRQGTPVAVCELCGLRVAAWRLGDHTRAAECFVAQRTQARIRDGWARCYEASKTLRLAGFEIEYDAIGMVRMGVDYDEQIAQLKEPWATRARARRDADRARGIEHSTLEVPHDGPWAHAPVVHAAALFRRMPLTPLQRRKAIKRALADAEFAEAVRAAQAMAGAAGKLSFVRAAVAAMERDG